MTNRQCNSPISRPAGKGQQAEAAFWKLMSDASKRGFFGTASLTISVQDGHVQQVRIATDQAFR